VRAVEELPPRVRREKCPGRESNPASDRRGYRSTRCRHRPPRARVSSWLRLFASAFLRASSARSASVRLVPTGASYSGACQRSLGCHLGTASVGALSGSPRRRSCETSDGGNRPTVDEPWEVEARGPVPRRPPFRRRRRPRHAVEFSSCECFLRARFTGSSGHD
jgi:hypothetical protein